MEFTSYSYLAFLIFAVALVRRLSGAARESALLGLSLLFYAWWNVGFLALLIAIGIFTFYVAPAVARRRGQLWFLLLPLAAILSTLGLYKYSGLVVEGVNLLLPTASSLRVPAFVLPLGISFFTFECISYLLDVYRGTPELKSLRRFLLLPAFWPHMIAGPILRVKELIPQCINPHRATAAESLQAIDRILFGFLKKSNARRFDWCVRRSSVFWRWLDELVAR